jgi:predicted small secreted protein
MKKTLATFAAISATALALSACETMSQRVAGKEDTLAAAGFTMLPANTPQRQAELSKLPPNKFVPRTTSDNSTQYVYADPVVCNCLYIGNQQAYGAYRQDVLNKKIADEQQMAAMTYQDGWDWGGWDWGPWGGGRWR